MFTFILIHDFFGKRRFSQSNFPLTTFYELSVFSSNLTYSVRVSKQTEYLTYADRVSKPTQTEPNYPDSVPNLRRQSIHATQAAYLRTRTEFITYSDRVPNYSDRVPNLRRQST